MPKLDWTNRTSSDSSPDPTNRNYERALGPFGRDESFALVTTTPPVVSFSCRTGTALANIFLPSRCSNPTLVLREDFDGTIKACLPFRVHAKGRRSCVCDYWTAFAVDVGATRNSRNPLDYIRFCARVPQQSAFDARNRRNFVTIEKIVTYGCVRARPL